MRRSLRVSMLVLCAVVAGCGGRKPPPAPTQTCVVLQAPERLNWFRGEAHTVYARVYALSSADAFHATAAEALLGDPAPFLPGMEGVAQSRSIHPDTSTTLQFKIGAQPIRSFGVVAGYYKPLEPNKIAVEAASGEECAVVVMGESGFPQKLEP